MARSEAQKRADERYRKKIKHWNVYLPPEEFEKIEEYRKRTGKTRREVLNECIKGADH